MELEKGASFSIEDLLEDQRFRAWILAGDEQAAAYWEHYLQLRPGEAETIAGARVLLLDLKGHYQSNDRSPEVVEAKLQAQLEKLGSPTTLGRPQVRKLRPNYRWAVAASILLLLVASIGWWWKQQQTELTYTTDFAEWRRFELPDGSEVMLNANSTLNLDKDWTEGHTRRVYLQGEAYFSVQKKPETGTKFQVITDDLMVEVLGTTFNVHSRGEQTEVFLEEGRVRLEIETDSTAEWFLQPGEKLAYSRRKKAIVDSGRASADLHIAWKDGLLKFDKTPMREVLQKVEDIYGISFLVKEEALYDRPFTSQGIPIQKLNVTLDFLAKAMSTTINLEDNIYVIE